MASFCQEFWKYLFLSGFFYFIVIGCLALIEFEPLRVKHAKKNMTIVACFCTAGVSFFISFMKNKFIIYED